MKTVTIHTDGGCDGNPGPGGWGAVLQHGEHRKEISGSEPATTNNRMELTAAIEALRALKEPCIVNLHTDSEYLRSGITSWVRGWKAHGWRTKDRKPVMNIDLWRKLDELCSIHRVNWHWVKGHAGHRENERCDKLAGVEVARLRKQYTPAQFTVFLKRFEENREPGGQLMQGPRG
ncbi:MAG TPA: ribonuclease HI [Verrucomicrobiae bacterium]|nr:ribonuclease HI [Verrucomicrobiae bacterium]